LNAKLKLIGKKLTLSYEIKMVLINFISTIFILEITTL
jgi:hypothetical protein